MTLIRTYETFLCNDSHHLDLNAKLSKLTYISLDPTMIDIWNQLVKAC